jgi:uncharacterized protein YndB with AHSA1/START domain
MSSGSYINQNIWVDRPPHEVFARWTDPTAIPRFTPGVSHVEPDGTNRSVWKNRCLGLPATMVVDVVEMVPHSRLTFTTQDGRLEGQVTFVGLNPTTTAVTVNATYRARNAAERVLAAIGIPSGRIRRTLVRFKNWAETQPSLPPPVLPEGRAEPQEPGDLPVPSPAGVTDRLGHQGPLPGDGSPGGGGSMGASSDDPAHGGWVGPAGDAGVPRVRGESHDQ